jgi:hypothetical protein
MMMMMERREPVATYLSVLVGISIATKYFTRFDVNNDTMAALSNTENDKFTVLKNLNKQQLLSWAFIYNQ